MRGFEKAYLRGLGQKHAVSLHVGKQGLSESFFKELARQLDRDELVKIRFAASHGGKKELASRIEAETKGTVAGVLGHTLLLYREHPNPERRKIRLPTRKSAPSSIP